MISLEKFLKMLYILIFYDTKYSTKMFFFFFSLSFFLFFEMVSNCRYGQYKKQQAKDIISDGSTYPHNFHINIYMKLHSVQSATLGFKYLTRKLYILASVPKSPSTCTAFQAWASRLLVQITVGRTSFLQTRMEVKHYFKN